MKILHLTIGIPPYRSGGLVNYCYGLAKAQAAQGNDVSVLHPGNYDLINKKCRIKKEETRFGVASYRIINPSYVAIPFGIGNPNIVMQPGNEVIYQMFLDRITPNLVHVHSFMGFHRELFAAIKERKIPIVYTTHDYYPICPKTSRINEKNENCYSMDSEACARCNASCGYSRIMQIVLQSNWYPKVKKNPLLRILKKRRTNPAKGNVRDKIDNPNAMPLRTQEYDDLIKYLRALMSYVDIIHCNSSVTRDLFQPYVSGKHVFIQNITTDGLVDNRGKKNKKEVKTPLRIGYIGIRDQHKGHWILRDAIEILARRGFDVEGHFYGDEFNFDSIHYPHCVDNGMFEHKDLDKVLSTIDLMVVPGYWYETFGFATLEAVANDVPVLVSTHTGSKDILKGVKTLHEFDPDVDSLVELLEGYLREPGLLIRSVQEQRKIDVTFSMMDHSKKLINEIEILINDDRFARRT